MDDATARMRLESMLHDLDRSIEVFTGERSDAAQPDAERAEVMIDVAGRQRMAVLAALKRLDEGGYGRCVDCRRMVPEGRLEARPEAARCVQCQSKVDRRR